MNRKVGVTNGKTVSKMVASFSKTSEQDERLHVEILLRKDLGYFKSLLDGSMMEAGHLDECGRNLPFQPI